LNNALSIAKTTEAQDAALLDKQFDDKLSQRLAQIDGAHTDDFYFKKYVLFNATKKPRE